MLADTFKLAATNFLYGALLLIAYGVGHCAMIVAAGTSTELVQAAIEAQFGPFRVSDIQHACPGVSLDMIRQVLKNLRSSKVECLGRGQNAQWQKLANG